MNILVVSQFSAENAGNYIATMLDLEHYLKEKGDECFFAFPFVAKTKNWVIEFDANKVLYLEQPHTNKLFYNAEVTRSIRKFVVTNEINLIHSNFDGYDYACSWVCKQYKIPLVVSFHDSIVKQKNIIKNIYQNLTLQLHYRWHTRKATVVFVSKELSMVRKVFGIKNYKIIDNGISLRRFTSAISARTVGGGYCPNTNACRFAL